MSWEPGIQRFAPDWPGDLGQGPLSELGFLGLSPHVGAQNVITNPVSQPGAGCPGIPAPLGQVCLPAHLFLISTVQCILSAERAGPEPGDLAN